MLIKVGDHVQFTRDMEISNFELPTKGEKGRVSSILHHAGNPSHYVTLVAVKLDRHFPELDEWENQIIWPEDMIQSVLSDLSLVPRRYKG